MIHNILTPVIAIMMLSRGPLRGSVIGASTLLRQVEVLMPMMCHSCSSSSSSDVCLKPVEHGKHKLHAHTQVLLSAFGVVKQLLLSLTPPTWQFNSQHNQP
jgi:hypothetical protein